MIDTQNTDTEILSDGKTVWINASDGSCIGRFSRFGIDLHRSATDQMSGHPECLDCSHERPRLEEWRRFQAGAATHYGVIVPDSDCPDFLQADLENEEITFKL